MTGQLMEKPLGATPEPSAVMPPSANKSPKSAGWMRWALIAALCVYAFAFQGSRGLWGPDEGRYTDVALGMLETGDWFIPRLNPEQSHLTKPPLTYWAIAAGVSLLGRTEWGPRLPNALAFIFTTLLVYGIGRRLIPRKPWLPALIYATSPLPFAAANAVTTDTLLTLWETLAVWAFVESWIAPERRAARAWLMLMWTAFGLAFLTKGPPGLLPFAAILAFAFASQKWAGARRLASFSGLAMFAIIGLSWFVMLIVYNPALFSYFVHDEVVNRVFTDQHDRNPQWYGAFRVYVPTLVLGGLPWMLLGATRFFKTRVRFHWPNCPPAEGRPGALFLLLWFLIPLVVFFIAKSRLPLYVLPLFVPLSLLLAMTLRNAFRWTPLTRIALASWLALLVGGKYCAARAESAKDARLWAAEIQRSCGEPIAEVLYVESKPNYGLRFYLDAEVEKITMDKIKPPNQTLAEEMREDEGRRIFLVGAKEVDNFSRIARRQGFRAVSIGEYSKTQMMCVEK